MTNMDHSVVLLIVLTLTELGVLGFFVLFIHRVKRWGGKENLLKATELFESIVTDSNKVAEQWQAELEEKQEVMRRLKEQIDRKIATLQLLCNRTESLVHASPENPDGSAKSAALGGRERKIITLARDGRGTAEIAGRLALAKEEVELVLGLEKRLARLGAEKGTP